VWTCQDQVNALRSALRAFYPGALAAFGTDLASRDALAVLGLAATPRAGREPDEFGRMPGSRLTGAMAHAAARRWIVSGSGACAPSCLRQDLAQLDASSASTARGVARPVAADGSASRASR
jgi:hypothetical protein